jgi:signal transduction histidine kinase
MTIRNKLSLQFSYIVASILLLFSLSIYFISEDYRHDEFINRLKIHGENNALKFFAIQGNENIQSINEKEDITIYKENTLLFNQDKELLYQSHPQNGLPVNLEWITFKDEDELQFSFDNYEIVSFPYKVNEEKYFILISGIDKYGLSKLENLRLVLIVGFLICLSIVYLLSRFYAAQALKPISKIILQVDSISEQNLHERLKTENNQDELSKLSQTFNKMLERIEDAFIMKRNFVSNASHELRTPLTAITGQLEVTLLKERSIEEYENAMKSVLSDIKKLNQICNGLLELTYANSQSDNLSSINIRIDELLWEIRYDIQKIHPEYQIEIDYLSMPDDENIMFTKGNLHLIRTALINVIDNACKYSPDKLAKVLLNFSKNKIHIEVKDNGIGISEEEQKNIFTPFYRSSNAKSFQGSGLGLALSKRIVEKYNGKISLSSQLNKGTTVFIELPVAA